MSKKTKTTVAALVLGALAYLAWPSHGSKNPDTPAPEVKAQEFHAEGSAPELAAPLPPPLPKKVHPRIAKRPKPSAVTRAEPVAETSGVLEEKQIPLPTIWNGQFEEHELRAQNNVCDDLDRPCSPRGRDGVLLAGVSIPLNGLSPQLPQNLAVGSYRERLPLLVYR